MEKKSAEDIKSMENYITQLVKSSFKTLPAIDAYKVCVWGGGGGGGVGGASIVHKLYPFVSIFIFVIPLF